MDRQSESVSQRIAAFVAGSEYSALSERARVAAKRAILDATGVMYAASGLSSEAAPVVEAVRAAAPAGPCSVLGLGDRFGVESAAFANGALAHALDYEDAFDAIPAHPNAAAIPAGLAMAQAFGPISGTEFITAVAVGCDVVCRLGLSLGQRLETGGWFPPPILGIFGATATASRLLRLNAHQTLDALGLALCQTTAPGEIMFSDRSVLRAVREAFPARAAVTAALLARHGVQAFEDPLEGRGGFYRLFVAGRYDPAVVFDALGSRFYIEDLSFKPWPACRGTHAFIELALSLRGEHGIAWEDIGEIEVEAAPVQRMLLEPMERKCAPKTPIDARFSIPFTLAVALVHGRLTLSELSNDVLHDTRLQSLARRVHAKIRQDWDDSMSAAGALTLRLRDGRVFAGDISHARGHPLSPLSTGDLIDKFVDCCGHAFRALDAGKAHVLAETILNLERSDDVGCVFRD